MIQVRWRVAMAVAVLAAVAGCGSADVEEADGASPVPMPVPMSEEVQPHVVVGRPALGAAANRLTCNGVPQSRGKVDHVASVSSDGMYVYPVVRDTPEDIAERWDAHQRKHREETWTNPAAPTVRFVYDRDPARARRVAIDFVTASGGVVASLAVNRRDLRSGWQLQTYAACAYDPAYVASTDDAFVDLSRGPRGNDHPKVVDRPAASDSRDSS